MGSEVQPRQSYSVRNRFIALPFIMLHIRTVTSFQLRRSFLGRSVSVKQNRLVQKPWRKVTSQPRSFSVSAAYYDEIVNLDDNDSADQVVDELLKQKIPPMVNEFEVTAPYEPTGDQPEAIEQLCRQLEEGDPFNVLRGITGTGKTFVMSHAIARLGKPTLVLCHNKTLAAQLARELKSFLGNNAVELFVSYYNHYTPESFVETTGKYIAKKSSINHEIDILRHRATRALLTRQDVVVVASVSCIYGLGLPKEYLDASWHVHVGATLEWEDVMQHLRRLQFSMVSNDDDFERGCYQMEEFDNEHGELRRRTLSLWPPYEKFPTQIEMTLGPTEQWSVSSIGEGSATGLKETSQSSIFPARHHVSSEESVERACVAIEEELQARVAELRSEKKYAESERLQQRVLNDVMLMRETGFCSGGENYSRHLAGRVAGEAPDTLLDCMSLFGSRDWTLFVDESHVTLPQLKAMYGGDQARKRRLVKHGYRLPSALDNRPLQESEFWDRVRQTVYVSATPSAKEVSQAARPPIDMVIRPTFVCDPEIVVRPSEGQLEDLTRRLQDVRHRGERALIVTLTKRDSEDLSKYLNGCGIASTFIHSGLTTNERSDALKSLQMGDVDCLVGVNCLREGLDLPQVSLVVVFNADSEGFLRSETALLQIVGRAARNENGKAIFYSDRKTDAINSCIQETSARRIKQREYNDKNGCKVRTTNGSSTFSVFDLLKDEIESEVTLDIVRKKTGNQVHEAQTVSLTLDEDGSESISVDHIPSSPGIYLWKDKAGNTLYIGKANKLRGRVKSYLAPGAKHGARIRAMISRASSVDVVLAPSHRDALLLESNMIKYHQPPFNILMKDDEHYPYICASLDDRLPRFSVVPHCPDTKSSKNRYFGPYTSFSEINSILQEIEEAHDLRAKSFEVRHGSGSREDYLKTFNLVLDEVFSSICKTSSSKLRKRRVKYEEASLLFESKYNQCRDVVAIAAGASSSAVVQVAQLRNGLLADCFSYTCQLPFGMSSADDRASVIKTVLEKHYLAGRESADEKFPWFPDEVLLPDDAAEVDELRSIVRKARKNVQGALGKLLSVSKMASRGEKRQIDARSLQFVLDNANQVARERGVVIGQNFLQTSVDGTAANELVDLLSLPRSPSRIECFDVSHTQGGFPVGSRVVFLDGEPARHLYRRFNIRTEDGTDPRDDYSSIQQLLERRFKKAITEKGEDWGLPDLIVVDGGPGQLKAATAGMKKSGVKAGSVPICSLAKNHEEVYVAHQTHPVNDNPDSPAILLLRALRDESHRFALHSHRRRRSVTKNN